MLEIREVKTRKEIKEFIDFPLNLYYKNEYFVPCLYSSEKALFKKDNCFASSCDTIYFNAYDDGKIVGRISGIIQKDANEKWGYKQVRFTRFDSINDQNVANALFDAVTKWAKDKGMDKIVGPLGFNDLEREGLLIEGFDKLSTFEEQYNYPYYQTLIENYGFTKDIDWIEHELRLPKEKDEKIEKLYNRIFERYHLHIGEFKSIKEFLDKHQKDFFDLLDETYSDLYGTVPLTKEVQDDLIKGFKLLLKPNNVMAIFNEKEEMVCLAICFPSIAKAVQKCEGKLTPMGIYRILKATKNPDILDLGLIGVRKDYLNCGIPVAMIKVLNDFLENGNYDHLETNLNLEDNVNIINLFSRFDKVVHKRRRSFVKTIE